MFTLLRLKTNSNKASPLCPPYWGAERFYERSEYSE
nr:MAG TPA: hypothetical protein [Caudoviricetes sp.]